MKWYYILLIIVAIIVAAIIIFRMFNASKTCKSSCTIGYNCNDGKCEKQVLGDPDIDLMRMTPPTNRTFIQYPFVTETFVNQTSDNTKL